VHFRRYAEADETEPAAANDVDAERAEGSVGSAGPRTAEREVAFGELQRGFETDEGMVVVSPEEIEAVRPSPSRVIAIEDFVDLADIDPVYFEKSYIVSARDEAAKPYALLLRAMERSGRAGIGRFVLRTKPHLAVIRPAGDVLALETMFFADEVRDGRSLVPDVETVAIADKEVELAQVLIETLKTDWDPGRYEDTYRQELLERIAERRPVRGPAFRGSESAGARIDELLEALRASVDEAKKNKAQAGRRSA